MLLIAIALQVSTTCERVMNRTECTSSRNGPIDYGKAQRQIAPYQGPTFIRSRGSSKPSKREKAAGKLIASGQCKEAEAYALEEGDFNLASQVRATCVIRARQP